MVGSGCHALFADGSLLLVTRRVHEGVQHDIEFWRVRRDYSIKKLVAYSFFQACHPATDCDLPGYVLPDSFAAQPVVHLVQTQQEDWGGVWGEVPVLDTAKSARTVELSGAVPQTVH